MPEATKHAAPHGLEEYLQLPYRMEVYKAEDCWAAEFPELTGLVAAGETWEELRTAIDDVKRIWFASMIEDGLPIPEPRAPAQGFSGKLVVRLPKSLHAQAARAAEADEVSLNTFIVSAVAQAL